MARRRKGRPVHGWLALDKPTGLTSTAALGRVKRLFDAQKAGHGGTLDPLASGVLPIAFGEATKTVSFLMDSSKRYRFTVAWGAETDTDDAEGTVVRTAETRPDPAAIEAMLPHFTGVIEQTPPAFSAIRIDGERAYDIARDGDVPALEPRAVRIDELTLIDGSRSDVAVFEAECGKGTYVRAIARDIGREIGCFGHVTELRRTRVGPFDEDTLISLEELEDLSHSAAGPEGLVERLHPVETVLDDIPALAVGGNDAARLRSGQAVIVRGRDAPAQCEAAYAVFRGVIVALGEVSHGEMRPTRVFNLPLS